MCSTFSMLINVKGGGGGPMLFHTFSVVYTVKELDSHAKHGQSFKKQFGRMNLSFIRFTRCYNLYLCCSIMNNRSNWTVSKNLGAANIWVSPPLCVAPPVWLTPPLCVAPPVWLTTPLCVAPPVWLTTPLCVAPPVWLTTPLCVAPPVWLTPPLCVAPPVWLTPPLCVAPPVWLTTPLCVAPPVWLTPPLCVAPPLISLQTLAITWKPWLTLEHYLTCGTYSSVFWSETYCFSVKDLEVFLTFWSSHFFWWCYSCTEITYGKY